jgi:hypothetical protein
MFRLLAAACLAVLALGKPLSALEGRYQLIPYATVRMDLSKIDTYAALYVDKQERIVWSCSINYHAESYQLDELICLKLEMVSPSGTFDEMLLAFPGKPDNVPEVQGLWHLSQKTGEMGFCALINVKGSQSCRSKTPVP